MFFIRNLLKSGGLCRIMIMRKWVRYHSSILDAHLLSPNDDFKVHFKQLADKVRYFKEDEKGVAAMCKVMEDMREETKIESAVNLLKLGKLTIEEIAKAIGLSVEKVAELAKPKTV